MNSPVARQAAALSELLFTHVALEGSLAGVDPRVLLQMLGQSETFVTDFTLMWFLAQMNEIVFIQSPHSRDRRIAFIEEP